MGRKIPGKKHSGHKDPEKQREKRDAELKLKINSAPKNIDDQEVPKGIQMIAKLKEKAKQDSKVPKPKKMPKDNLLDSSKHMGSEMRLPGMKKPLKAIPIFQQQPGEKQRQFFRRMNQQVSQFLSQKQYEAKYNVDLVQDPENGKTKFVEREKDELEEHVDKLKSAKLAKKGIVRRSKEEKRKEKRLKEKEKRLKKKRRLYKQNNQNHEDFNDFNDKVEFNDVVHAPPKLNVKNNEARRPGRSKDLIFLDKEKMSKAKVVNKDKKQNEIKSKKKIKQRISLAKQQMLENDRISIVEQYRALKQKK